MKIIAIDIGTINFAYSIVDVDNQKIIKWDTAVIGASKDSYNVICYKLYNKLKELDLTKGFTDIIIVIELQTKCNIKTTIMSGEIMMYYTIEKESNRNIKKVVNYHAGNKLKYYVPLPGDPPIKTDYASKYYRNKKMSEQHCFITLGHKNEKDFLKIFEGSKKKDDLADSYLMALAYIKFEIQGQKYIPPAKTISDSKTTKAAKTTKTKAAKTATKTTKPRKNKEKYNKKTIEATAATTTTKTAPVKKTRTKKVENISKDPFSEIEKSAIEVKA